jgi:hypothetical protein
MAWAVGMSELADCHGLEWRWATIGLSLAVGDSGWRRLLQPVQFMVQPSSRTGCQPHANSERGRHEDNERTTMLNKANTLKGYTLNSLDGALGQVKEFYFDDKHWTIRYLVADTGNWLTGRQVLISPHALIAVNTEEQYIAIELTKQHIEDSPSLDSDQPVSRQFEKSYFGYYGWPAYWDGPYLWGPHPHIVRDRNTPRDANPGGQAWDPHLRSTRDVSGHHVQATDGEIGHVEDFLIDDETWAIRYLIIDTRNWWPGRKVLVSPRWIERVSWSESKVFVSLTRQAITKSPEYTDESLLTRDDEVGLHRHYNRQGYWVDE